MKCTTDLAIHEASEVCIERQEHSGTRWIEVRVTHDGEVCTMTAFLTPHAKVSVEVNEEAVPA